MHSNFKKLEEVRSGSIENRFAGSGKSTKRIEDAHRGHAHSLCVRTPESVALAWPACCGVDLGKFARSGTGIAVELPQLMLHCST